MSDPDRLAEIQARRARVPALFDSHIAADIDWLVGEVQDRRTDLAVALSQLQDAIGEIAHWREIARTVGDENERLRGLLRGIEWAAGDDFGAACPECQGYRDSAGGHLPDCDLAAAALHPETQGSAPPSEG